MYDNTQLWGFVQYWNIDRYCLSLALVHILVLLLFCYCFLIYILLSHFHLQVSLMNSVLVERVRLGRVSVGCRTSNGRGSTSIPVRSDSRSNGRGLIPVRVTISSSVRYLAMDAALYSR